MGINDDKTLTDKAKEMKDKITGKGEAERKGEEAGQKVDEAANKAGNKIQEGADKVQEQGQKMKN